MDFPQSIIWTMGMNGTGGGYGVFEAHHRKNGHIATVYIKANKAYQIWIRNHTGPDTYVKEDIEVVEAMQKVWDLYVPA